MRFRIIAAFAGFLTVAPIAVAQQAQKAPPTREAVLTAARSIIGKARFGTLVTLGEKGEPHARVVDPFTPDSAFTIWVATNRETRKVKEIKADPRVVLLWFEPGNPGYVSLSGHAELVSDRAEKEKYWKAEWRNLYKDRNRGDDYLLVRIKPTHMEVVSYADGLLGDPETWKPVTLDFR